jgi:hypothetical protein
MPTGKKYTQQNGDAGSPEEEGWGSGDEAPQKGATDPAHRPPNDQPAEQSGHPTVVMNGGGGRQDEVFADPSSTVETAKMNVSKKEKGVLGGSAVIHGLMEQYLGNDYSEPPPVAPKPGSRGSRAESVGSDTNLEDLENNLNNLDVSNKKKQPPPPIRHKPPSGSSWSDPKNQQRPKQKEAAWPPRGEPRDIGAYVVESYGQTDPYSNKLIKDIQKAKREEEERMAAEKRAEIVDENIKPVSSLRSTFAHKPSKPRPGMVRPEANINDERSWITHEKKAMNFDTAPDEPDWMKLIRNRRWQSTVKARFPCKSTDKTEFERRSTTPKNWKKLAQDKNALKMLSEVVGIGAEGEELFMRLATQRQKMEEEQEKLDRQAEEELMAYQVARESLGEDAAYSLQMDNPLPAARMVQIGPTPSVMGGVDSETASVNADDVGSVKSGPAVSSSNYPFTTSQLEAAYLTNQLLRLHPEEFKKLMSLERSRQATLRWQFSSDPFDSVHEHQSLPYEIAMLASQEPRVQQAMRRIVAQSDGEDYFANWANSRASSKPRSRMARSEGYASRYDSDNEGGYESATSCPQGAPRGRRMKKPPVPPPKNRSRGRSISPTMMGRRAQNNESFLKMPTDDGTRTTEAHGLFNDEDVANIGDDVAKIDELTASLARNIDDDLARIESTLDERKRGFFEESLRNEGALKTQGSDVQNLVNKEEIASRRKDFVEKDRQTQSSHPGSVDGAPKARHKVRRISSDAQLNAVFRKRRQASECEDSEPAVPGMNDGGRTDAPLSSAEKKAELNDLVQNITTTFG